MSVPLSTSAVMSIDGSPFEVLALGNSDLERRASSADAISIVWFAAFIVWFALFIVCDAVWMIPISSLLVRAALAESDNTSVEHLAKACVNPGLYNANADAIIDGLDTWRVT